MKKLLFLTISIFLIAACQQKKETQSIVEQIEEEVLDSTLYGICGEGTMMHTLQLITNMEDTVEILINDEDVESATLVVGGLMSGDRMAVTTYKSEDGLVASRIINLTSLLGKWSSIDKSFEMTEDGEVVSDVKLESRPWTSWRILNGNLLLNRDTFCIVNLGADSLELENTNGIYFYKRVRDTMKVDTLKTK